MIRVNLGGQRRPQCKDITHLVEVSPSPYDIKAYAAWKEMEAKRKADLKPVVVDKKDKK